MSSNCPSVKCTTLTAIRNAQEASQICRASLSNGLGKVKAGATRVYTVLGKNVAQPINKYIFQPFVDGARKTVGYMKDYWQNIVLFSAAWAVVVVGIGITGMGSYPFSATTLSLTIGMGAGMAAGLLTGIFTHKLILHKSHKYTEDEQSWHSLWGVINNGIWKLPEYSVRPLVIAVAVTVIIGVATTFPTAIGVVIGLLIGNHLAIRIGYWDGPWVNGKTWTENAIDARLLHHRLISETQARGGVAKGAEAHSPLSPARAHSKKEVETSPGAKRHKSPPPIITTSKSDPRLVLLSSQPADSSQVTTLKEKDLAG